MDMYEHWRKCISKLLRESNPDASDYLIKRGTNCLIRKYYDEDPIKALASATFEELFKTRHVGEKTMQILLNAQIIAREIVKERK